MAFNNLVKSNLHFDTDIENELACVVFNEIHYINDKWMCEYVCKHNIVNSDSLKSGTMCMLH